MKSLSVLWTLFASSSLVANDQCRAILDATGRDESYQQSHLTIANYAYEQLCSGRQARADIDINTGVSAVIEALPVRFTGAFSSRREKVQHFCKTQEEWGSQRAEQFNWRSNVVREAIAAFLTCRSMEDVNIHFESRDARLFSVGLTRTRRNARFKGLTVVSDGEVACDAPNRGWFGGRMNVDSSTVVSLSEDLWTITCIREPISIGASGDRLVPRALVQIETSEHNLQIPLPEEHLLGPATAREFRESLAALDRRIKSSFSELRSVSVGQDLGSGRGSRQQASQRALFCALVNVFADHDYKNPRTGCSISRDDSDQYLWTLAAEGWGENNGEGKAGAATCRMVCIGPKTGLTGNPTF